MCASLGTVEFCSFSVDVLCSEVSLPFSFTISVEGQPRHFPTASWVLQSAHAQCCSPCGSLHVFLTCWCLGPRPASCSVSSLWQDWSGAACFRVCVLGFVCWTHWYLGDETHSSRGIAEQICSQPIISSFIGVFLQRDASHCLLFSAGVLQPLQERQGQHGADPPRPLGPLL